MKYWKWHRCISQFDEYLKRDFDIMERRKYIHEEEFENIEITKEDKQFWKDSEWRRILDIYEFGPVHLRDGFGK